MKPRAKRRLPRGWAEGLEFPLLEPKGEPPKRRRKNDVPIVVTDDWPERVPIGEDEVRIVAAHMQKELDELFGGPLP